MPGSDAQASPVATDAASAGATGKNANDNPRAGSSAGDERSATPLVLTGSADGQAQMWDSASASKLEVFGPQTGPVTAVAVSPDGQYVVTAVYPRVPGATADDKSQILNLAGKYCSQALTLNPKLGDAFQTRADILRLQQKVDAAWSSAYAACSLGSFRESTSLRLLAEVEAGMQDFNNAAVHASQAAYYAGDADQRKNYLDFCGDCDTVRQSLDGASAGSGRGAPGGAVLQGTFVLNGGVGAGPNQIASIPVSPPSNGTSSPISGNTSTFQPATQPPSRPQPMLRPFEGIGLRPAAPPPGFVPGGPMAP